MGAGFQRVDRDEGRLVDTCLLILDLFLEQPELGFVWMAYDESGVCGVSVVCYAISTSMGAVVAKLDDVSVKANLRGGGIGTTLLEQLKKSIFECLDETFVEVHGIYLDKGCSLFPTLEGVSAQEASGSVSPGSATVAAQVEHVRFYLDVLNDIIRTKEIVKVDWKEIWRTVNQVTPEEWEEEKRRLQESYERVMTTLKSIDGWDGEDEVAGALSVLSHTAYHLGGIRQALGAIRSARKTG